MKYKSFIIWLLVNILLPFVPFILKVFINYFSLTGQLSLEKIVESNELIFYSLTTCVIILNINLGDSKSLFEFFFKLFVLVIMILDFILLTVSYSKLPLKNINTFLYVSVIFPTVSAPIYKFIYKDIKE